MICDFQAEILPYLGKDPDDPAAGLVQSLHQHAETLVKKAVGSRVEWGTWTDILPAHGPPLAPVDLASSDNYVLDPGGDFTALALSTTPVRVIVGVNETTVPGGGGWPAGSLLSADAYWLDAEEDELSRSGLLYRTFGRWPMIPRSVRVVYQGGWKPEELAGEASDFKLAVQMATVAHFRQAEAYFDNASGGAGVGPMTSESIMGWTQDFDAESLRTLLGMQQELPPAVLRILASHVNYSRKLGRLR